MVGTPDEDRRRAPARRRCDRRGERHGGAGPRDFPAPLAQRRKLHHLLRTGRFIGDPPSRGPDDGSSSQFEDEAGTALRCKTLVQTCPFRRQSPKNDFSAICLRSSTRLDRPGKIRRATPDKKPSRHPMPIAPPPPRTAAYLAPVYLFQSCATFPKKPAIISRFRGRIVQAFAATRRPCNGGNSRFPGPHAGALVGRTLWGSRTKNPTGYRRRNMSPPPFIGINQGTILEPICRPRIRRCDRRARPIVLCAQHTQLAGKQSGHAAIAGDQFSNFAISTVNERDCRSVVSFGHKTSQTAYHVPMPAQERFSLSDAKGPMAGHHWCGSSGTARFVPCRQYSLANPNYMTPAREEWVRGQAPTGTARLRWAAKASNVLYLLVQQNVGACPGGMADVLAITCLTKREPREPRAGAVPRIVAQTPNTERGRPAYPSFGGPDAIGVFGQGRGGPDSGWAGLPRGGGGLAHGARKNPKRGQEDFGVPPKQFPPQIAVGAIMRQTSTTEAGTGGPVPRRPRIRNGNRWGGRQEGTRVLFSFSDLIRHGEPPIGASYDCGGRSGGTYAKSNSFMMPRGDDCRKNILETER